MAEAEAWTAGPRAPWVQVDADEHEFVCERCSTRERFPTPVNFMDWHERGAAFLLIHKLCKVRRPVETIEQGSLL